MLNYTLRRLVYMIVVLTMVSLVSFIVIQLPPGDFLSMYIMQLQEQGTQADEAEIASLRNAYGLDLPIHTQYLRWIGGVLRGNFGRSFQWNMPVRDLIGERLALG